MYFVFHYRTLDRERARAIQQRKREEQSGKSLTVCFLFKKEYVIFPTMRILCPDDDDDDEDSEEDRETPSYTAISNTPTRITLTAKVSQKRKRGPNKIKVKDQNIPPVQVCLFFSVFLNISGGSLAEWLEHWTCESDALNASWILFSVVQSSNPQSRL